MNNPDNSKWIYALVGVAVGALTFGGIAYMRSKATSKIKKLTSCIPREASTYRRVPFTIEQCPDGYKSTAEIDGEVRRSPTSYATRALAYGWVTATIDAAVPPPQPPPPLGPLMTEPVPALNIPATRKFPQKATLIT